MTDLQIPDAVDDLWFECGCQDKTCGREGYQEDALRIVAAAELRRFAALFPPPVMVDPGEFDRGFIHACDEFCRALNRRADELDGGVS